MVMLTLTQGMGKEHITCICLDSKCDRAFTLKIAQTNESTERNKKILSQFKIRHCELEEVKLEGLRATFLIWNSRRGQRNLGRESFCFITPVPRSHCISTLIQQFSAMILKWLYSETELSSPLWFEYKFTIWRIPLTTSILAHKNLLVITDTHYNRIFLTLMPIRSVLFWEK